jgi:hypothetical protein
VHKYAQPALDLSSDVGVTVTSRMQGVRDALREERSRSREGVKARTADALPARQGDEAAARAGLHFHCDDSVDRGERSNLLRDNPAIADDRDADC